MLGTLFLLSKTIHFHFVTKDDLLHYSRPQSTVCFFLIDREGEEGVPDYCFPSSRGVC